MKLLLCLIILGLTSCSHSRNLDIAKGHESVKYIFNDNVSFGFKIPNDSIDRLPNGKQGNDFSVQDIKKTKQNLFWVLNRTYQKLSQLTFSGKYSVGVGASFAGDSGSDLTLSELKEFEEKYSKDNFNMDVTFEEYNINNRSWIVNRNIFNRTATVTAYTLLNGRSYLIFSFDYRYIGDDNKVPEALNRMYQQVLNSFWLKKSS